MLDAMVKNYFIILMAACILCQSCNNDSDETKTAYPPINEMSYIQGFYDLESNNVSIGIGYCILPDKDSRKIYFRETSENGHPASTKKGIGLNINIGEDICGRGLIDYQKINPYRDVYFRYVNLINDTSYNSDVMDGLNAGKAFALTDTLQAINIVSNKDFNAEYKAGSNLNDLFFIYFEEPYTTIKNGYKSSQGKNYYEVDIIRKEFPYTLYGELLSKVDFSKKYFISPRLYLVLEAVPDETAEYTFTVTIKNTQGKEVTVSANAILIKGKE